MLAPLINPKTTNSNSSNSPKSEDKTDGIEHKKPEASDAERIELLKDYYKQLQALFPGVDPNKEPPVSQSNPAARAQAQQLAAQQQAAQLNQQTGKQAQMPGQVGGSTQGQNQGSDLTQQQQKMQQELLRQKMMQQAQQQHAQNQHQLAQGMQGMNPQQPQNR
jgi:hypothetical protein